MDIILTTFLVLFVLVGALIMYSIIVHIRGHTIEIREKVNNKNFVTTIKFYESLDKKTSVTYWKNYPLLYPHFKQPRPEEDIIDITKKGRFYAVCYKTSEDEVIWARDKPIDELEAFEKTGKIIRDTFKPYSATQREVVVNQHRIAEESNRNKQGWTPAKIMMTMGIGGIILIIIMAIVYAGDILDGYRQIQDSYLKNTEQAAEVTAQQARITANLAAIMQALNIDIEGKEVTISQSPGIKSGGAVINVSG